MPFSPRGSQHGPTTTSPRAPFAIGCGVFKMKYRLEPAIRFVFRNSDNKLVGGITLGNIRRGVGQNGMIGYWSGEPYAGKGYMTEALSLVIPFAFDQLRLHRIEAACIPHNQRSIRLLEKAGFEREGLLRSYLKINGFWQDHLLFALIESDKRMTDNRMINGKVGRS